MPIITPELDRILKMRRHLRESGWRNSRYSGAIWYLRRDSLEKNPYSTEQAYVLQCDYEANEQTQEVT